MTSSDPKDHPFGGIFKVLSKKDFLDRPESILSYMRDANFQKIMVNVVETLIGFERRRFLLSMTCPEDDVGGHVHTMSENCYLSEKVVGDIVRGIRSEIYREPVETIVIQFGDHGDCREALDGSAVYSMDLTELLWVSEDVAFFENPKSVKIVEEYAFRGCCLLNYISIPDTVERINDYAFENCTSLQYVTIPDSIFYIGESTFNECSALYEISVRKKENAKQDLSYLQDGSFGTGSFSCCRSLCKATVPRSMTEIGEGSFDGCYSLREVMIPDTVKTIKDCAFADCKSLEHITLPNTVRSIGEWAFINCLSLKEIVMPNTVRDVGSEAFMDCKSLKKVVLSEHLERIEDSMFSNCSSLIEVIIPNSVLSIGFDSFYECTSLQHIIIPDSVKEIEHNAFYECINLRTASVPADLDIEGCFPDTTEIIRRPHP